MPLRARGSAATLLGDLGIRPDVIDRCLNHVEQNRMIRTYQRQELLRERQVAFEALGTYFDSIAGGDSATITPIALAQRRKVGSEPRSKTTKPKRLGYNPVADDPSNSRTPDRDPSE